MLYNPQRERLSKRIAKLTEQRRAAKRRAEVEQYNRLADEAEADGLKDIAKILRQTATDIRKGAR